MAHQPNEASRARKSSTACAMSDLELWPRCAFPILHPRCSDGQRLLLSAVAFLLLLEVHIQHDNAIEHFGVSNGHLSPSWRLLQPTARIAREMLQSLRRSPSLLQRVSPRVVWMDVPTNSLDVLLDVRKDIIPVVPISSAQICENPKWAPLISTHIYHHITHLLMFSQTIRQTTNVQTDALLTSSTTVIFNVQLQK